MAEVSAALKRLPFLSCFMEDSANVCVYFQGTGWWLMGQEWEVMCGYISEYQEVNWSDTFSVFVSPCCDVCKSMKIKTKQSQAKNWICDQACDKLPSAQLE